MYKGYKERVWEICVVQSEVIYILFHMYLSVVH